jgi:hypothetical protein
MRAVSLEDTETEADSPLWARGHIRCAQLFRTVNRKKLSSLQSGDTFKSAKTSGTRCTKVTARQNRPNSSAMSFSGR